MEPLSPFAKTFLVLVLALAGLSLGMALPTFSGTTFGWLALAGNAIVIVAVAYRLIRDFWRH
jgi:hypothetical protein